MSTLADIVTKVKATRLRGASQTQLEADVLEVHKMIMAMIPDLRQNIETPTEITLVNSTRAYALPAAILQVSQVVLQTATANTYRKLDPCSIYKLMSLSPASGSVPWVKAADGVIGDVERYAIVGVRTGAETTERQIVLDVKPAAVTTEKLLVYGAQLEATPSTSTVISTRLNTSIAYVEGLSWRAACAVSPNLAPAYFAAFQAAIEIEKALLRTEIQGLSTSDASTENVRIEN